MPGLLYKKDWDTAKDNYKAWWEHEYFGRCLLLVTAPTNQYGNRTSPPVVPDKVEDRWLDLEYLTQLNEYNMSHVFYGCEAFPIWNPGYPGCDTHAAYLGAEIVLGEDTGWQKPFIDCEIISDYDYHQLKIDYQGRWWEFGQQIRLHSVRKSQGRSIPSNMAFGACGDTLAAIRGSENLLFDIVECPDHVRDFDQYLMKQWIDIYEASYKITHTCAQGSTCWFALWAPGKFYAAQNDFAYMISPKMFIDIFIPSIELQTNYLDYTIYHVDGTGNFAHVDALLELPKLQAIQILPGTGKPGPLYYLDILRKIQSSGKNLHITLEPNDIETALELLSARGLSIETVCSSEEEAQVLIKNVERWSVDRG
ncbi:MAG: hypothetical protein PHV38_00200 [Eubacteriales bacterium]|nr:hypothetical protein [Eubacteriales bacterium]